jgi:hypothetical protein
VKIADRRDSKHNLRKKHMKTITNIIYLAFAALTLTWFALSPVAQALNPPPDGGYPGSNTAEGTHALFSLTTGTWNTALGFETLNHDTAGGNNTATGVRALFSDTSGSYNSATGIYALYSNINGWYNSAVGAYSLANNISGNRNTANGYGALYRNTAEGNTATGFAALYSNTTGSGNVANGYQALFSNTTGEGNTANGYQALYSNTTGGFNTANGYGALYSNTAGFDNTANGYAALYSNTTGNDNTANGLEALPFNTTGSGNTAYGSNALLANTIGDYNTAYGDRALYSNDTGSRNIALGVNAGDHLTTGSNNIEIGNRGVAEEGNTIRIGVEGTQTATFIAGISVATVTGTPVVVNASGQLGVAPSSQRFKDEIKSMNHTSEAILALNPVTFRYKPEIDSSRALQFGLVAEEVEKVNPNLVARDAKGEVYTVRYEAVNAMLLNEFLKEHRTVQEQQKEIDALRAELKEQRALIQKVSDKVELNRPAPQTAENR